MSEIKYHLEPNNNPLGSLLPYNQGLMTVLGLDPSNEVSEIDPLVGIAPQGSGTELTPQGPVNDLMSLRQRFPFLNIMPIPNMVGACVLTQAVTAGGLTYYTGEMRIPEGAVMGRIMANDEIYCSRSGTAEVPNTYNTNPANGSNLCQSFQVPNSDGAIYYLGGIRTLAFASPTANTVVTAMCYAPDQYPR